MPLAQQASVSKTKRTLETCHWYVLRTAEVSGEETIRVALVSQVEGSLIRFFDAGEGVQRIYSEERVEVLFDVGGWTSEHRAFTPRQFWGWWCLPAAQLENRKLKIEE